MKRLTDRERRARELMREIEQLERATRRLHEQQRKQARGRR